MHHSEAHQEVGSCRKISRECRLKVLGGKQSIAQSRHGAARANEKGPDQRGKPHEPSPVA